MELNNELFGKIIDGDANGARSVTERALQVGASPEELLETAIAAMKEVGRRFENREFFVPEMLVAARAMKTAVELLRPRLLAKGAKYTGKVVIGTVSGDLHDIGKNLVIMMLEGSGFEVIDLGVDVPKEKFVAAVQDHAPQILGMSALLTTTMLQMRAVVDALQQAGLRDKITIMVGGAPVTQRFATDIGADLYGQDASAAARLAEAAVTR